MFAMPAGIRATAADAAMMMVMSRLCNFSTAADHDSAGFWGLRVTIVQVSCPQMGVIRAISSQMALPGAICTFLLAYHDSAFTDFRALVK